MANAQIQWDDLGAHVLRASHFEFLFCMWSRHENYLSLDINTLDIEPALDIFRLWPEVHEYIPP